MIIHYEDSIINKINIISKASAYNNLKIKIEKDGSYRNFRDKMSSKEMLAFFNDGEISELELFNMASTSYNVVDDSLLVGKNLASGDSIYINFFKGEINRIQVKGGALGEFYPEQSNSKVDTTISYGGEFLDYHDQRLSKIAEGYLLQAVFYYITGDAFCDSLDCRLNNAHWQKDLIHSQIKISRLCKKHQKILDDL